VNKPYRLEVALHESGHSVVARALGVRSGRATLCDHDGVARSYFSDDEGIASVMAILAGRAATLEILGRADDEGCSLDDAQALRLIEADGFRERFFAFDVRPQALLAHARELVRQHRRAVEAVANALLAKETLSAAEINQLMMDAEAWRHVTR
jgi:ATP-dependent Zn protease